MQIIEVNNNRLSLFDSIKELPVKRYIVFQKYILLESGVGSSMESISERFARLFQLLGSGLTQEAHTEAKNLYYTFYMMLQEINPLSTAFACLVHSVNEEPQTDFSHEALTRTVDKLQAMGLTYEHLSNYIAEVKKNSPAN